MAYVLAGCAPVVGTGPGHRQQELALTPEQELQIGRVAYAEVLSKARVVRSGPEVERVRRVAERIAQAVAIEPLQREINLQISDYQFEWEYAVIDSPQINAFCLPGGKIGVFSGLLDTVENDDQLAAVIAHEVAHALAHHASERIANEARAGILTRWSFDREQELEADHIGIFLMAFAGYDPRETLAFWQKMQQSGRVSPPEILSDHPSDAHRLQRMREWVPLASAAKKALDEGRIAPAANRKRSPW
jgi:predicted Zn-dependent protease